MKKIFIEEKNIPITDLCYNTIEAVAYIDEYRKEMNVFIDNFYELKKEYSNIKIKLEEYEISDIYLSEENKYIFKYNRVFYEDNDKETKIIRIETNNFSLLIKDKEKNEMYLIKTNRHGKSLKIFSYKDDILIKNFSIWLKDRKEIIEHKENAKDVKSDNMFLRIASNVIYFSSESRIVKIEKSFKDKEIYEIKFNPEKTNIVGLKIENKEIKKIELRLELEEDLPKEIINKIKNINNENIKEVSDFIKNKNEIDSLMEDGKAYPELLELIKEVEKIIIDEKNRFYFYDEIDFKLIDIIIEEILEQPYMFGCQLEVKNEIINKNGLEVVESSEIDINTDKIKYEHFNIENISEIFNIIDNTIKRTNDKIDNNYNIKYKI